MRNSIWLQIIFCSCVKETLLSPPCDRSCMKMADCFASQGYSLKKNSVSRRSIICRSRIIDLLATDKSRYFAQPCHIIVNYFTSKLKSLNFPLNTLGDVNCRTSRGKLFYNTLPCRVVEQQACIHSLN